MSLTIFNKLPEVLLDQILLMYWMDIYSNKVLKEFNDFINTSIKSNLITKDLFYSRIESMPLSELISKNELIYFLINNKALAKIAIMFNQNLKWVLQAFNTKNYHLFEYVKKEYQLICVYSVNVSGEYRYHVYHHFTSL